MTNEDGEIKRERVLELGGINYKNKLL